MVYKGLLGLYRDYRAIHTRFIRLYREYISGLGDLNPLEKIIT